MTLSERIPFPARALRRLGALLAAFALISCGGGDGVVGSGGTGSPLGMAVGTVNGFGSVVVDGQPFDDRSAAVVTEVAPGVDVITEARLGDRVAVEYETPGVARVVRVEAALVGAIDGVGAPGRFTVLGQAVAVNADGALGPLTQFGGGYATASDLRAGDAVEVHGLLLHSGAGVQIQATRIERLGVLPEYLRVRGVVGALRAGASPGFVLGALAVDLAGAKVLPESVALADGQEVTVLALAQDFAPTGPNAWRLKAAQVRIGEPGSLGEDTLEDSISGSVAALDGAAHTFSLGSLHVDYAAATLSPAGWTPADEQYVLVRGTTAADGAFVASSVTLRDAGSDSEAELHGTVTNFVPATMQLAVRGVAVDASTATFDNCPSGLANGMYVEIEGAMGSSVVVAKKVRCEDEPAGASVEREGTAGSVDTTAHTFSLAVEHGAPVAVRWSDETYFGDVTPSTLSGRKVQVEGSFVDGVLQARKIKKD